MKLPWSRLNKGVRRLLILGYVLCIGKVVLMHREPLPSYELNPWFDDPYFAKSNKRDRLHVEKQAADEVIARRERTYYYLLGYPLGIVLCLWVYTGFFRKDS